MNTFLDETTTKYLYLAAVSLWVSGLFLVLGDHNLTEPTCPVLDDDDDDDDDDEDEEEEGGAKDKVGNLTKRNDPTSFYFINCIFISIGK